MLRDTSWKVENKPRKDERGKPSRGAIEALARWALAMAESERRDRPDSQTRKASDS